MTTVEKGEAVEKISFTLPTSSVKKINCIILNMVQQEGDEVQPVRRRR